MAASAPSLRWLHLAILGPLILLAGLAWWGTRSQLQAAWADARAESERLAPGLADSLANDFRAQTEEIPIYPNPPVPGPEGGPEDPLDSEDQDALLQIVADPDAGLSPAGLPRRALAGLRLLELDPGRNYPTAAFFLYEAASVLTPIALSRIPDDKFAVANWDRTEKIRELAATHAFDEDIWIAADLPTYIHRQGNKLETYVLPARHFPGMTVELELPKWVSIHFTLENESPPAAPLAAAPVPLGHGLTLNIIPNVALLEAPVRRQQLWMSGLLAAALATAGIALVAIQRAVSRERRLAELKSQFVSSVSHELRAPLGSIRLMAETLQQERTHRPAEFLAMIARESARLSHLIENVLDFARIEEGRKHYRFEECDLTALIHDTLCLMQPPADERRIAISAEIPEITSTVDPAAVQQALVNLLDNAIKFSPEDATITVTAASHPQAIRIAITDHGPGIPASEHARIFERFHRLGNELRRETQGTGLGLSIVKHIAEAHHGGVTVTSHPPDGSTFTLTLPLEPCAS